MQKNATNGSIIVKILKIDKYIIKKDFYRNYIIINKNKDQ